MRGALTGHETRVQGLYHHRSRRVMHLPNNIPSIDLGPAESMVLQLLLDRSEGGLSQCAIEIHAIVALMRKRGTEDASPLIASLERKGYVRTEALRIVRLLGDEEKMVWETGDLEDVTFIFVTPAGAAWGQARSRETVTIGKAST